MQLSVTLKKKLYRSNVEELLIESLASQIVQREKKVPRVIRI